MKKIIFIFVFVLITNCSMLIRKSGFIETKKGKIIKLDNAIVTIDSNYYYVVDGKVEYIIPREIIKRHCLSKTK